MNLLNDSRVRDLLKKAALQGFVLEAKTKRGHHKIIPPDATKPAITISSTSSDCNFYWELRRMLKRSGYVE